MEGKPPTKRGLRTRTQLYPAIFLREIIIFNLLSYSKAKKLTRAEYAIFITRNACPVEMNSCSSNCKIPALFNLELAFSSVALCYLRNRYCEKPLSPTLIEQMQVKHCAKTFMYKSIAKSSGVSKYVLNSIDEVDDIE
jgi:hypothetical protein